MTINNRLKMLFIIISIYYIPYLVFDWAGVAGVRSGVAPFWYKCFRIILPILILFAFKSLNFKEFRIKILSIILILFNFLSNLFCLSPNIEISIFFLYLIFFKNLELNKKVMKKFFKFSLYFSCICVYFEKNYLFNFFGVHPPFVMSWQERYIGNMAGPNTLGAFVNIIYTLLIYCEDKKYKKIIYFIISFYIIDKTDSDAAIIIFILINAYYIYINFISFFSKMIFIINGFILLMIVIIKKGNNFIMDGSNITRVKMILGHINDLKLLSFKEIFNESPYFLILFSYGIIAFLIYIYILYNIYIEYIKKYKNNKKFYELKKIILFQILLYSLVLPIKFIFPMNILYVFSLKLKDKK